MGITFWLGLLALIGVPLLILIYILKPKFQERKISSTYIWKLSLKYRKRKIPIQWLKSLLLIIQCLIVVVMTFLIAKPYLKRSISSYAYEKVVIIDASASMMTESEDGVSRFDRAKDKASEIAETAKEKQEMTVISCSDKANVLVDFSSSPEYIQSMISSLQCTGTSADYAKALREAQKVLERNAEARVTLITDHKFKNPGYVEVIDVSANEWNLSIDEAWEGIEEDEKATWNGKNIYGEKILLANIFSYNRDATVIPCVDITFRKSGATGSSDADYETVTVKMPSVDLKQNQMTQVKFDYGTIRTAKGNRLTTYKELRFYCTDTDGNLISDAFSDDDIFCIFGGENTKYNVYLRGDDTDYTYMVVGSVGFCNITQSEPKFDPVEETSGFDLYIYDHCMPRVFPSDGAVWIIDPVANTNYGDFGFTTGGESVVGSGSSLKAALINPDQSSNELLKNIKLVKSSRFNHDAVFSYSKYTQTNITNENVVKTLIVGESNESLILAGKTDSRIKFTVFNFDLEYTDFPLVFQNFPVMIQNMVEFSLTKTIDTYLYEIGEEARINVRPDATEVTVSVGEEGEAYTKNYKGNQLNDALLYETNRGGVHTITQTLKSGETATEKFYVRCNSDESNFGIEGGTLTMDEYEPTGTSTTTRTVANYELLKYIAGALVILLLIEWGLQYREQY